MSTARVLVLLLLIVGAAAPAAAQTETAARALTVGATPAPPDAGTTVRLTDLASSGTGLPLFTESDGDMFRRALAKADLPSVIGYLDEAETWSLLQTFTSGLTSNGLVTIGGSNDLLLGTGGMRAASGAVIIRNVADSSDTATFGDSAIALLRNTAVTGTFSASGLSTLTGGFTASAASTIGADLTFSGTGRRLLADMSNATLASRFALQTSTTNGTTNVVALPNGTSTTSLFQAFNNATPTNAALVQIQASSTEGSVRTATTGSGTAIPLVFQVQAGESFRLLTDRNIQVQSAVNVGTDNYASQTTGWRLTGGGALDARYVYTDELHAKAFIADLEMALNGGQIIAKSTAILASAFTCPAAGGTATLTVNDFPGFPNIRVFAANDWVVLRTFSRTDGDSDGNTDLTIGDCVGQVSSYVDGTGTQSWTFTRGTLPPTPNPTGGTMAASTVVEADAVVIDFGVSGQGFLMARANDGTEGANAPYWQTVTWTTAPVAANMSVRTRWGQLNGSYGYSASTYGFATGNPSDVFVSVDDTNGIRMIEGGSTVRGQWAIDGSLTIGSTASGQGNVNVDTSGNLRLRSGTNTRIQLAASNGTVTVFDAGGTGQVFLDSNGLTLGNASTGLGNLFIDTSGVARFRVGSSTRMQLSATSGNIALFDSNGKQAVTVEANNFIVGDFLTANRGFVQVTDTSINLCASSVGCPLIMNGSTGDITSAGNILLSTGGNVTSAGNWSLTQGSGLAFATAVSSELARSVSWAGGSKLFEGPSNRLNLQGQGDTVVSTSGAAGTEIYLADTEVIVGAGPGVTATTAISVIPSPRSGGAIASLGTGSSPWDWVVATTYYSGLTQGITGNCAGTVVVTGGIVTGCI